MERKNKIDRIVRRRQNNLKYRGALWQLFSLYETNLKSICNENNLEYDLYYKRLFTATTHLDDVLFVAGFLIDKPIIKECGEYFVLTSKKLNHG